jgi:hypothetical protein
MFKDKLLQNHPQTLSNCLLPNRYRFFSDKWLPNGIPYSAIKERQIAIVFYINKRALNCHRLFSNKIAPNYQQLLSNIRMPIDSNHLAMLVMPCWCHQARTRGYVLGTILHLLKTY